MVLFSTGSSRRRRRSGTHSTHSGRPDGAPVSYEVPTVTMTSQDLRIAAARGLFEQQGVMVAMPDLNSSAVSFGFWFLPTDVLVGALQEANRLATAVVCAKHRIWMQFHRQVGSDIRLIDEVKHDDDEGRRAVDAIHDDLVAFARQYVDDAAYNVQQIIYRAQTALQRSPSHLNRTHQLGAAKVTVKVTIHRDLRDYLATTKAVNVLGQIQRLASSPFRHLEVTITVERHHRGKWRRVVSQDVEVHVAHDRWIPASQLLKALRRQLSLNRQLSRQEA